MIMCNLKQQVYFTLIEWKKLDQIIDNNNMIELSNDYTIINSNLINTIEV